MRWTHKFRPKLYFHNFKIPTLLPSFLGFYSILCVQQPNDNVFILRWVNNEEDSWICPKLYFQNLMITLSLSSFIGSWSILCFLQPNCDEFILRYIKNEKDSWISPEVVFSKFFYNDIVTIIYRFFVHFMCPTTKLNGNESILRYINN